MKKTGKILAALGLAVAFGTILNPTQAKAEDTDRIAQGVYIGNIFNETKHRQSYFIQEILNGSEKRKKENEKEISDYRGK